MGSHQVVESDASRGSNEDNKVENVRNAGWEPHGPGLLVYLSLSGSQLRYRTEVSGSGTAPDEEVRSLEAIAFLRQ